MKKLLVTNIVSLVGIGILAYKNIKKSNEMYNLEQDVKDCKRSRDEYLDTIWNYRYGDL